MTTTELDLRPQLEPLVAGCKLGDRRVTVELELTFLEIVDVRVQPASTAPPLDPERQRIETCVTEALWDASLMLRRPTGHQTRTVELGAAR